MTGAAFPHAGSGEHGAQSIGLSNRRGGRGASVRVGYWDALLPLQQGLVQDPGTLPTGHRLRL